MLHQQKFPGKSNQKPSWNKLSDIPSVSFCNYKTTTLSSPQKNCLSMSGSFHQLIQAQVYVKQNKRSRYLHPLTCKCNENCSSFPRLNSLSSVVHQLRTSSLKQFACYCNCTVLIINQSTSMVSSTSAHVSLVVVSLYAQYSESKNYQISET